VCLSVWIVLTAAAEAAPRSALVRWQPRSGVAGYRVYVRPLGGSFASGIEAGLPPAATDGTLAFTVGGLDTATSYSFAVTDYLASGLESALSNELTLVASTPPTTTVTSVTTTTVTTSTTTTSPATSTTTTPATTSTTSTIVATPCGPATVVPAQGGSFTGVTSGTSAQSAACASTGSAPERVFQWTPAVSGVATISTCSATATTFDTVLYLRDSVCSTTQLACNDDTAGCGTTTDLSSPHRGSVVRPTVTAGQTYFVVVDGYAGAQGSFALTITPPGATEPVPAPCAGATLVPAQGGTFTGVTSGTSAQSAACATTASAPERVFRWTPAVSGVATISTCSATATTFDTVLYLRDATCTGGQLACNDDTAGCGTTTDLSSPHRGSVVRPTVTAGQTYFVVVDGYAGASGSFALTVAPPSAAAALTVGGRGRTLGTLDGATETTCVAPVPCQQATWDEVSGCVLTPSADGAPCEALDPCLVGSCLGATCEAPDGLAAGRALEVGLFVLRPAGDRLRVAARGGFTLESALDPTVTGLGVEFRAPDGGVVYRAALAGAALRANRSRTTFRYVTKRGRKAPEAAAGLDRLTLAVRHGKVGVMLTADVPGTVVQAAKARLTWVLRLGGQCARGLDLACSEAPGRILCRGTTP
jgi:hypothetical protein